MSPAFFRDCGANVAVVFALLLPALGAGTGAALDYSRLASTRSSLQRTVDAAAIVGVKALASSTGTVTQRQAAAVQAAQATASGTSPLATSTATAILADHTVRVVSSQSLNLLFGSFLGRSASTVGAAGTAVYSSPTGCITALSATAPTGIAVQGSARISAPNCPVWSNSTNATSSVTVASAGALSAGKVCAAGGGYGSITPALTTSCEAAVDPFAGRVSATTQACGQNNLVVTASTTLSPTVYCGGLTIKSGTVTLSPGLYEIRNGPLTIQGASVVNGTGVSFLLGPGAYLDFQGNPTINISAMTSGSLAGILFGSDPTAPAQSSSIQGNISLVLVANMQGSIYLPNQSLSIGGSSDVKLQGAKDVLAVGSLVVAGAASLTSSATYSSNLSVRLSR